MIKQHEESGAIRKHVTRYRNYDAPGLDFDSQSHEVCNNSGEDRVNWY